MTYAEDELLPISALQHLAFCERQCALIHVEQAWAENRLTAEGRILHDKVHEADAESRGDVRVVRGLRLRSLRLGLIGMADVVEFHRPSAELKTSEWQPFPVEYKRGKPKHDTCDDIQLCAQAMCLEEMLNCRIPAGALFYGAIRRRHDVVFDAALRQKTEDTALRLHELVAAGITPPACYGKKCENCSLLSLCMPETAGGGKSADRYLDKMLAD
ncbi:MAG: CRISPR-associated protein Cas4 [Lentisphaerae bacterium]|nr:CRISPR-associated protein Cas4 [Lentisphaerota bacterium]